MYENPTAPLPDGPFEADWHSIASQYRVPDWYRDAKFGIFIHWGPYSVPAFQDEWYPRKMYLKDDPAFAHHAKTWGPQNTFGYKDFIPLFKAEKFDANAWAELFHRAGARYVVPVAEHHDGFAMYDTALSRWSAAKMGPKRDVIGEIAAAVRKRGMKFGLSNHRAEHWWFMEGGRDCDSDVNDPAFADLYGPAQPQNKTGTPEFKAFKDDWLARACEQIDKYRPSLVYFDTWVERPPLGPYRRHVAAYYYNRARTWRDDERGVAINYKNDAFAPNAGVIDVERGQMGDIRPYFWQSDTAVGKRSWCHIENEEYKPAEQIIADLCDIVSKNGTMLLNIGPKADGTIADADRAILDDVGRFLAVNGEAIYGTRPWKVFGEGPTQVPEGHFTDQNRAPFTPQDWRFTTRGRGTLYAINLGRPAAGGEVLIRSLGESLRLATGRVKRVTMLGAGEVRWSQDASGVTAKLPERLPLPFGCALKIEF
jgi:alpha-L-fucosidase